MATVQVTTFAAFADAVKVQGDTVEVMNDLDIAAEYQNGYPYPLNIKAGIINGNGHAIKNIRDIDGDADALFQFGENGQWISDPVNTTVINRLHFRNCVAKKHLFWNGNWCRAAFYDCYIEHVGTTSSAEDAGMVNYSYCSTSRLEFCRCWLDIKVRPELYAVFWNNGNSSSLRLDFENCVINLTQQEVSSPGTAHFYTFLRYCTKFRNSLIMGEIDASVFDSSQFDIAEAWSSGTGQDLEDMNSYVNISVTNNSGLTSSLSWGILQIYPSNTKYAAINTDKLASGVTFSNDDTQYPVARNTDVQMKSGRGLDIKENPTDSDWHLDPAYNNGYPYFVFAVPELQALWAYNPVATPKLFAGSDAVTELYLGSEPVERAYLGDDVIA